jgi:hypothetical protein
MPMFEIKSRWDGRVLFALECGSLKLCVEAAVKSGAILDGAILDGARLDGAILDGARLVGAILDGARLDGARLDGARLVGAILDGARLDGAKLVGAILDGARLDGARLDGAKLVGAILDGARLVGARLDGARLVGAILDGARLDGARLDGARLVGASLKNCKWGPLTIQRAPIAISIPNYWQVYILDSHMQIGCELHSFEEWRKFKDSRIKLMDDQALAFWKQYGPALLAMCATRETGGDASGGGDEWATPCT